jgi:hypothetical protein
LTFIFWITAAALALLDQPGVEAEEIVRRAMKIAGDICVYTNHSLRIEQLDTVVAPVEGATVPVVPMVGAEASL